jgi:hypothetical protein
MDINNQSDLEILDKKFRKNKNFINLYQTDKNELNNNDIVTIDNDNYSEFSKSDYKNTGFIDTYGREYKISTSVIRKNLLDQNIIKKGLEEIDIININHIKYECLDCRIPIRLRNKIQPPQQYDRLTLYHIYTQVSLTCQVSQIIWKPSKKTGIVEISNIISNGNNINYKEYKRITSKENYI